MPIIDVVGAGLAGCEAAWQIAARGSEVRLIEMKPKKRTPAHSSDGFAELVCSNSLRAAGLTNAVGLLKEEMRILGSLIMEAADKTAVDAGGALAVDRQLFSEYVTERIRNCPLIAVEEREYTEVDAERLTVIATGPLTSDALSENLKKLIGEDYLCFFDAAAPIVSADSIDFRRAFIADRYGNGGGSYVNCPMDEAEYGAFCSALSDAEQVELHDFEDSRVFEGCMPIEVMARRGRDTMRFGPLKPVGLVDPRSGKRPYAVVQLRKENAAGNMYNLVGFQTHLTFPQQRRVFRMIPGLEQAEFLRYGVMHRNTFVNAPQVLDRFYRVKSAKNVFLAGQMTGVEGYVESAASGLVAGINAARAATGREPVDFTDKTAVGALQAHVSAPTHSYQPMNINFGIISPLGEKVRDKKLAKQRIAERALQTVTDIAKTL